MTANAKWAGLVGQDVKLRLKGDPYFGGVTLRWGTLAAIEADGGVIVDNYHDSSGIGAYVPPRGCNVKDAVPCGPDEILSIERDWHVVS